MHFEIRLLLDLLKTLVCEISAAVKCQDNNIFFGNFSII